MNDGGQAFPVPKYVNSDGMTFNANAGATLRDYFAAAALQGLLANPKLVEQILKRQDWVVESALAWGEVMCQKRGKEWST